MINAQVWFLPHGGLRPLGWAGTRYHARYIDATERMSPSGWPFEAHVKTPISDDHLSSDQIATITAFVDIEASAPVEPTAHVIFGTNQAQPVTIVAERYHRGVAPLVIVTGGVNRHNGIVEGREFHRLLTESAVPASSIRCEDQSAKHLAERRVLAAVSSRGTGVGAAAGRREQVVPPASGARFAHPPP